MAMAMTLTKKSSVVNLSKHSSPIINPAESFSPDSSLLTLSPESSNSVSSPDKSFLSNTTFNDDHQYQSIRLVDYFIVSGLDKTLDVEPSCELLGRRENMMSMFNQLHAVLHLGEQVLNPFQCSYRCRVLHHYPHEVLSNIFDEDAISRVK